MSKDNSQEKFVSRLAAVSAAVVLAACAAPAPAPAPAAPPPPVAMAPMPAPAPAPPAPPAAPPAPPWWQSMSTGRVPCELGESLDIRSAVPGTQVDLVWKGAVHKLMHVPTSSGAYRYEEKSSGMVLIHIPAKMMLMNQKQGKRLADECHF